MNVLSYYFVILLVYQSLCSLNKIRKLNINEKSKQRIVIEHKRLMITLSMGINQIEAQHKITCSAPMYDCMIDDCKLFWSRPLQSISKQGKRPRCFLLRSTFWWHLVQTLDQCSVSNICPAPHVCKECVPNQYRSKHCMGCMCFLVIFLCPLALILL